MIVRREYGSTIVRKWAAGRFAGALVLAVCSQLGGGVRAQPPGVGSDGHGPLLSGEAAFGDWTQDRPGVWRKITGGDLPEPFATRFADNNPSVVKVHSAPALRAPRGFSVELFLSGLTEPRLMRRAPNGDVFLSEGTSGRVLAIRAADGARNPNRVEVFAHDLRAPFGINFYPPGPDPKWVYVAETDAIVRFPYRNGDLVARGSAEPVIAKLPISSGGHWTRDIVFSPDGQNMYVSIGSASDVAEDMGPEPTATHAKSLSEGALGAAWGSELNRADVLVFDPQGRRGRVFATGLRNCVGLAVQPKVGDLWCSVAERDGLGDDTPPDFITRIKDGGFYGWPWFWLGQHEDPHHKGERPDLAGKITMPDVLVQAHSVPLGLAFYESGQGGAAAFPREYEGDVFVALHGSFNRERRTGYKVVRLKLNQGRSGGEYEDFLTGFVVDAGRVSGRPVGVVVAHDGALWVSEDSNGTLWRVAWRGEN